MSSILDQQVLVLNRNWQAIDVRTVREAILQMAAGAATGMNFEHGAFQPTRWEDWVKLPIGEGDVAIRASHSDIRAPKVVVAISYDKVPKTKPKATTTNLLRHYGHRDYYTGKKLSKSRASKEHVKPKSRLTEMDHHTGGNDWENLAPVDREINSLRGNMSLEEFAAKHGYKPQYEIRPPKAVPVSCTIQNPGIPEWDHFLIHRKN